MYFLSLFLVENEHFTLLTNQFFYKPDTSLTHYQYLINDQ